MITLPTHETWSDRLSGLPAVTRATGLISGLIRQMKMDAYREDTKLARPRILHRPDPTPNTARSWFVGVHVNDYLRHGNAINITTVRDEFGLPLASMWLPAQQVGVTTAPMWDDLAPTLRYWFNGRELPTNDVVHVRRGADPWNPWRGVGVLEEHLTAFRRLHAQQNSETDSYNTNGVPSVVVTVPNADTTQEEMTDAKNRWMQNFQNREPAIVPAGTVVTPVAWSPKDSQMSEAHGMSLQDVANMFGMDGFWTGTPSKGLTYKSPGPLFLSLTRETIEPISDDFEQVWGDAWLPMDQQLWFHKPDILADDLPTEMGWMEKALGAGVMVKEEVRPRLGLSPKMPTPVVVPGSAPAEDRETGPDIKAQFDAMGMGIRSGVMPEDAATRVGLEGLKFRPGFQPITIKTPGEDAPAPAPLEDESEEA